MTHPDHDDRPTADDAARRLRLFVAVELPEAWLSVLSEAQSRLRQRIETRDGPRLRWVRPEGIHLTLKFLGETPAPRLTEIEAALADAVPEPPRMDLALGELGMFSSGRRARVLWTGLTGDLDALSRLAQRIDSAVVPLGFPRETRPFAPHLTLARVPEGAAVTTDTVASHLQTVDLNAAPFRVEHVSLIRSRLVPGGARYERLAAWPA